MRIGALVLAAGASERLGTPKQLLLDARGQPLISSVVHAVGEAGFDPIVVVIGAHAEEVTHALIRDAAGVFLVAHRGWHEGMGSSIRAGIASMSTHGMMTDVVGTLITACDMPTANSGHFAALRAASLRSVGADEARAHETAGTSGAADASEPRSGVLTRVASEYGDPGGARTRGIPAVIPRHDWPALLTLHGDRGAKAMFDGLGTVTVQLEGGNFDLDTPADVVAWRASH